MIPILEVKSRIFEYKMRCLESATQIARALTKGDLT